MSENTAASSSKTQLHFAITIQAPREQVWRTLLAQETYRQWTAAFAPDSCYEGSWDEGAEIRFIAPGAGGMLARIAEARPPEFVSIEHLGMIDADGVIDRDSPAVRAWTPAFENYTLTALDAGTTELRVDQDISRDYEAMMQELWPKALAVLKTLCE
jgi:uncharacterized protein YndB with AHSA1/START domain